MKLKNKAIYITQEAQETPKAQEAYRTQETQLLTKYSGGYKIHRPLPKFIKAESNCM